MRREDIKTASSCLRHSCIVAFTTDQSPIMFDILDFDRYTTGDKDCQLRFARELVESLSKSGFVRLKNYGISEEEVDQIFALVSLLSVDN